MRTRWVRAHHPSMGDYDAINEHNAAVTRAAGWSELTGTPDQVRWAITRGPEQTREVRRRAGHGA